MKQKKCNIDVTHVTGEKACETNNCGGVGVGISKEEKEAYVKDVDGSKESGEIQKRTELQKSEE